MMFTVLAITITGPDKLLRAFAAMVVLFILTDASGFAIEFLKLLFSIKEKVANNATLLLESFENQ